MHPKSLENLTYHEGRPLTYGEPKKRREVSVTDTGWMGVKAFARARGLSVSELLERIGRFGSGALKEERGEGFDGAATHSAGGDHGAGD